jgi:membrane peptidoglycan carboxypeptidase
MSPDDLDWAQAALLAGLPEAPSAYDPLEHLRLAKLRQRHVLNQLVVNHYLTVAQANAAYGAPLGLK